jgi:hypothetical protein
MENASLEITENEIISFLDLNRLTQRTDLCNILEKHGSDKCSNWHNYSALYDYFFKHFRDEEINFFEVGIYHGSSVKSWREYFSKAKIYTADVDKETFLTISDLERYGRGENSHPSFSRLVLYLQCNCQLLT